MALWDLKEQENLQDEVPRKRGLSIRVEKNVNKEVRCAILKFARWLRKEYSFPYRVIVYVKASERVRTMNGEMVYDTCFRPADKTDTPYIRISTGDYESLVAERGRDNALAAILCSMASMLTHYYQWVHDMDDLTEEEEEQQADQYANLILTAYAQTCDHP